MMRSTSASAFLFLLLAVFSVAAPSTTTTGGASKTPSTPSVAPTLTTHFIFPTTAPSSSVQPPPPKPSNGTTGGALGSCPGPLIVNSLSLNISTCIGTCCLRCPAINNFYEPNKVDHVLNAAYVARQISLAFSFFMALSYLVLPGKRLQPHISVLFLTVSLTLWYAAFDIMPGVSNACVNEFEQSTARNSKLCGAQGILIIYLTQTSALWCSLLIYKLHLLAVWRSDFIDRYYKWFTGFCWVFPLAFAIPVAVQNIAEYPGIGFSCLVSTPNLNTYLFYPTAVYMYPAMICHVITIGKMIQLAVISSRIDTGLSQLSSDARERITTTMQAKRLLRGQWRPALMMGTVMTCLTVFWLFYYVDAHRLEGLGPATPWLQEWFRCVMIQGAQGKSSDETQTICARIAVPYMPSIPWFTTAEMLLGILGIVVAIVFISKVEFWEEWAYMLSNILTRGKRGSSSSRGRRSPIRDDVNDGANGAGAVSPTATMVNPRSQSYGPDYKQGRSMGSDHHASYNQAAHLSDSNGSVHRSNSKSVLTKDMQDNGGQWYDMEDLLGKEYNQNRQADHPQRALGYELQAGMTARSVPSPASDPSRYQNDSLRDNNALYRSPIPEAVPTHWSPSAPAQIYLSNNNGYDDRFIEQPVMPSPVPRTPKMTNNQPVYLSNQRPQSPMSPHGAGFSGSLSPMPARTPSQGTRPMGSISSPPLSPSTTISSPTTAGPTPGPMDSVPIIAVATRGKPSNAVAYTHAQSPKSLSPSLPSPALPGSSSPLSQRPVLPVHGGQGMPLESGQIMFASREPVSPSSPNLRVNTNMPLNDRGYAQGPASPPPMLPMKSPARHTQYSPTGPY